MATRPVTVTTTMSQIVPYNSMRSVLIVQNNGTDTVFISEDPTGVSTSGLVLTPGDAMHYLKFFGAEPETERYAVANTGSQNLRITEFFGPVRTT